MNHRRGPSRGNNNQSRGGGQNHQQGSNRSHQQQTTPPSHHGPQQRRQYQNEDSQQNQHHRTTPNQQSQNPFKSFQNDDSRQNQQNHSQFNQADPRLATPPPTRSGECVKCKSVTVLMCQRCEDFYCSVKCQKEDWSNHRYVCFRLPALVNCSAQLTHDIPPLNGYQNNDLALNQSVHLKWVNKELPESPQQRTSQTQQQQKPQQQYQQQTQQKPQQQYQQQTQPKPSQQPPPLVNRATPPRSEKSDASNKAVNIGRVEQADFPKNNSSIQLTSFLSSNRVYIRSIESEENIGYCNVIKAINQCGKTAAPLKSMPARNAFAITDFNQDGLYYRVQVASIKSEDEINVVYFDFGNAATKKLSELKEISHSCAALKQYIVLAMLKDVPCIKNSPKIDQYLKTFEDIDGKIVYTENEKPYCTLNLNGAEDSLNKKIVTYVKSLEKDTPKQKETPQPKELVTKNPLAAPQSQSLLHPHTGAVPKIASATTSPQSVKSRPSQLTKPVMTPPFELVHLPLSGKNLQVVIMDNSLMLYGYFGCVLVDNYSNVQAVQTYLNDYDDKGKTYKPKSEEYCLAKFEGSWYRAKVLSIISPEFVEVVFIDFLNESEVSIKDIRRYPMDLDLPCMSNLCMIDDLPELSDSETELLKEKFQPGTKHIIDEIKGLEEDESNCVVVRMSQVTRWLSLSQHSLNF